MTRQPNEDSSEEAEALLLASAQKDPAPGVERAQMLASLQSRLFGQTTVVRVGRFELQTRRGAGAMGIVYEAHDPQLDRKVALKLLRGADFDPERVERLTAEARALAKLRHPNVVTVYEVGRDGDDHFIVMDLVQGETLRSWLETPRPWQDIVRMFIGAGKGLAAAHAAGLVHRDFKPDNVLVEDGRPMVVDFGLAAPMDDPTVHTLRDLEPGEIVLDRFTCTGGFVGTPVYMAPEQYRGEATAAADQYAFCVALFEALEGRRPHAQSESSGVDAFQAARAEPLPAGLPKQAPRWLRRALARGLAEMPGDRWPSMARLIEALRRVDGSRRRRTTAGIGVLGVAVVAGVLGSQWADDASRCSEAASEIRASWSPTRRTNLRDGFVQTGLPYAEDTWQRVEPLLERYAQAWSKAAGRACAADLAAERPLPPLNRARAVCLDRRLSDFESLLDSLDDPKRDIVDRAVDAASTIPPLSRCGDTVLLRVQMERGETRSVADAGSYSGVAAADVAYRVGEDDEAMRLADDALRGARAVSDHELEALASMVISQGHRRKGAVEAALASAADAVAAAEALGDSRLRVRAQVALLAALSERRDFDAGKRLARFARASLARLDEASDLHLELSLREGWLLLGSGELEAALHQFEQTEAASADAVGLSPSQRGRAFGGKGAALAEMGRYDEAAEAHRRAVELLAKHLGEGTPSVVESRLDLATALSNFGRPDEGIAEAQRAVREADDLGSNSLLPGKARATLGIAYASRGMLDEAEPVLRTAAIQLESQYESDNPAAADGWINLARVLAYNDKSAEAIDVLKRAASLMSRALPDDHPDFIYIHTNLADAYLHLGEWEEGLESARRAEAIAVQHFSGENARLAPIRTTIGAALRGVGDLEGSAATLTSVLEDLASGKTRPGLVGLAEYEAALTAERSGAMARARDHMIAAKGAFEDDGGNHLPRIEEIDAWLDEHS